MNPKENPVTETVDLMTPLPHPDDSSPYATVETITVERAHVMLSTMENLRRLRPTVAERYAVDMRNGNWAVGTSAILIDKAGRLRDGQHRLQACILADVPFTTVVIWNVDDAAVHNCDRGLVRQYQDILASRGVANPSAVQASVALGWRWDSGYIENMRSARPTFSQSDEWFAAHVDIAVHVVAAGQWRRVIGGIPSVLACFRHRIHQIDVEAAELFGEQLVTGANLEVDDPVRRLRDRMLSDRNVANRRSSGEYQLIELATMCKAWNLFMTGQTVKQLVWRRGTVLREEFPTLVDGSGRPFPFPDVLARGNARKK
jgi:hypothetical protein